MRGSVEAFLPFAHPLPSPFGTPHVCADTERRVKGAKRPNTRRPGGYCLTTVFTYQSSTFQNRCGGSFTGATRKPCSVRDCA